MPNMNRVSERYKGKINFISALSCSIVDSESMEKYISNTTFLTMCYHNEALRKYGFETPSFKAIKANIQHGRPYTRETLDIASECARQRDLAFNRGGSTAKER